MIDQINSYKRLEGEVELKFKQISSLKLDASSVEAVSQLKGKHLTFPHLFKYQIITVIFSNNFMHWCFPQNVLDIIQNLCNAIMNFCI